MDLVSEKIKCTVDVHQKTWSFMRSCVCEFPDWQKRTAISDGKTTYSYSRFFAEIEKYASVFSALSITQKEHARVGLIGTGAAETIISFYALNMTGADVSLLSPLSALRAEKLIKVVKDEHLTDLIITDDLIQDNTLQKIIQCKDQIGLRFILLLHIPIYGAAVPAPLSMVFEQKAYRTRCCWGMLYMDYLVRLYGHTPISYAENASCDTAVILHTSGTTGGSGSPIVMSDRALNAMSRNIIETDGYNELKDSPSIALLIDLSNAYGLSVQVHMPLCLGGKLATVPCCGLNPLFFRIIPAEKISVFFCTAAVIEMWMKSAGSMQFDFSSLRCVIIGGSSISSDDKRRYLEFFCKYGMKDAPILNGYGISELGGVCTLSSPDISDESIGYLIEGVEARLFDEETETFKSMADAPCTGVLYLRSETMSTGILDGKELVKTDVIDDKPYICTNDLVSADTSGRLTYLGRANRYFLHSNGVKYQSGRVEAEISRQPGIKCCGVVPVYHKTRHDNIPMLCVSLSDEAQERIEVVRKVLVSVFADGNILSAENLPSLVLIADELPRNANGKIDLYRLNRGEVSGEKYEVKPQKKGNQIVDVELEHIKNELSDIVSEVYKDIAKDIAEESVPCQVVGGIKQVGSAIRPVFHLNAFQYLQFMMWLFQMWQLFCLFFNSQGNNKK